MKRVLIYTGITLSSLVVLLSLHGGLGRLFRIAELSINTQVQAFQVIKETLESAEMTAMPRPGHGSINDNFAIFIPVTLMLRSKLD